MLFLHVDYFNGIGVDYFNGLGGVLGDQNDCWFDL